MILGYIREDGAGPTKESQRDKLRAGGVNVADPQAVYEDVSRQKKGRPVRKPADDPPPLKDRADLIKALRPGDVVVVASPAILGTGRKDIAAALRAITDKGAAVKDAATGQMVTMQPDAEAAFAFLERAEGERLARQLDEMRQKKLAMGAKGGRPQRMTAKRKTEGRKIWADMTLTAQQAADKIGISVRTGYRLFGTRGVPVAPKEPSE